MNGIVVRHAPILWTVECSPSGARTLLAGGRWDYISIESAPEDLFRLLKEIDGLDRRAAEELLDDSLLEALLDSGALRLLPYDAPPARLLVLATYVLVLAASLFVRLLPRRAMSMIARHLDPGSKRRDGWAGETGETVVAAVHRAAALPFATTKCVPVAVATYWLLRLMRKEAAFCLAATSEPFEAHIWVRHNGHDLDPRSEAFAGVALEPLGGAYLSAWPSAS